MSDFVAFLLWLSGQPPQEPQPVPSGSPDIVVTQGGGIPIKPPTPGTGE